MSKPKGPVPRITKALTKDICDMLEIATAQKYAAIANGVSESLYYEWISKGEDGTEPYATFSRAVKRARARAVPNMHVKALKGERGSAAALWFLEHQFRDEYGSRSADSESSELKIVIEGGLPECQQ